MKRSFFVVALVAFLSGLAVFSVAGGFEDAPGNALGRLQGEMAGEVTDSGAILQGRLTAVRKSDDGDVPSAEGWAGFQVSVSKAFEDPLQTEWIEATEENDCIVKSRVGGLEADTRYYYRLIYGPDKASVHKGPVQSFQTLPHRQDRKRIKFAVVTGMNYYRFHDGPDAYEGPDKSLGYPALEAIAEMGPRFVVFTGDNVYYDHGDRAMTEQELRKKWHEQFVQERFHKLFSKVPAYWEKDDHDYRYNDCDNWGIMPPSPKLGKRIFKEQVPVTVSSRDRTYRTHRAGKLLQIWLLEGRDHRSPNIWPDGPRKTLWGKAQKKWLKRTLLASDADFKIIISPTPMVGPDDGYKRDNHTNPKGFRHEGESFFSWARHNGFLDKGLYLICGDRHWQYHSIHPEGFQEFSSGALVDANSRMGIRPGDPQSIDPEGKIVQPYTSEEPSGGYLMVDVKPEEKNKASITFNFYDENGKPLYQQTMKQN